MDPAPASRATVIVSIRSLVVTAPGGAIVSTTAPSTDAEAGDNRLTWRGVTALLTGPYRALASHHP